MFSYANGTKNEEEKNCRIRQNNPAEIYLKSERDAVAIE